MPSYADRTIPAETPSIELGVTRSDPTKGWLQVKRLVKTTTAAKKSNF